MIGIAISIAVSNTRNQHLRVGDTPTNSELREDGGLELREDGGIEVRE